MSKGEWVEATGGSGESWDKLEPVQGIYLRKKENVGRNKSNMYVLKVEDKEISVWGSAVIDGSMGDVPIGSEVRIEPLGEAVGKTGVKYNNFKVMFRIPEGAVDITDVKLPENE